MLPSILERKFFAVECKFNRILSIVSSPDGNSEYALFYNG